ncbi:MAG: MBL fold metallo-hydrolase [Kiritimatiellales bacterium]|nr:MBL fold metallo-hydrolase [Kiritimatiellales bacterium]
MKKILTAFALFLAASVLGTDSPETALLKKRSAEFRKDVVRVADNVYTFTGYSVQPVSMIVGTDGLVIVDTGMDTQSATSVLSEMRKITDLPVKAIILTHGHGDHTGGLPVFAAEGTPVIWARGNFGDEAHAFEHAGLTITKKRGARQGGFLLPPEKRINNGVARAYYPKRGGAVFGADKSIKPTHDLTEEPKTIEVAGIKLDLVSLNGETKDALYVWYAEQRVLFAGDNFYKSWPNLYPIRGSAYRDVQAWADSVDKMLQENPDAVVPGHTRPVIGKALVMEMLTNYRDAIRFVFDKTIEGMNKGLTPDELVDYVKLPAKYAEKDYLKEYYGNVEWAVRSIFAGTLGWFDGNPTTLFSLPVKEEAKRMAALAGGQEKLEQAAFQALEKQDYQWTAQLCDHLIALDPSAAQPKLMKAEALEGLAPHLLTATGRNYYLTCAQELREQVSEAEARPRQRQQSTTIASIGDAVMKKIDLALPDELYHGYLFWHQADELATDVVNYAMLLDAEGKIVHRWDTDLTGGGHTSYLLESGGLLRMGIRDRRYVKGQPVAATDTLQITDTTGQAVWELSARNVHFNGNKITFHHDMQPMPNGNVLVLIYEEISPKEAAAAGWTAGNGKTIWSDGVLEIEPDLNTGSFEIVWSWRFIDHMIQDQDANAANYGVIADHPEKIDGHFPESYAPMNAVRQHLNSLDYHPGLDQIVVSSFIYNEIWVIDHSTTIEQAAGFTGGRRGKGGDLLFRYGDPAPYGKSTEADRIFQKQHDTNWVDEGLPGAGNLLVFNNNTSMDAVSRVSLSGRGAAAVQEQLKGISNVYEISPSVDNGRYVTGKKGTFEAKQIWFWEHKDFFAPFQGGTRRLANGNTLLTDTVGKRVWEVAPDGDVVVRYKGPAPSFKSFKYSPAEVEAILNP